MNPQSLTPFQQLQQQQLQQQQQLFQQQQLQQLQQQQQQLLNAQNLLIPPVSSLTTGVDLNQLALNNLAIQRLNSLNTMTGLTSSQIPTLNPMLSLGMPNLGLSYMNPIAPLSMMTPDMLMSILSANDQKVSILFSSCLSSCSPLFPSGCSSDLSSFPHLTESFFFCCCLFVFLFSASERNQLSSMQKHQTYL
jgi:hypothetical protein